MTTRRRADAHPPARLDGGRIPRPGSKLPSVVTGNRPPDGRLTSGAREAPALEAHVRAAAYDYGWVRQRANLDRARARLIGSEGALRVPMGRLGPTSALARRGLPVHRLTRATLRTHPNTTYEPAED